MHTLADSDNSKYLLLGELGKANMSNYDEPIIIRDFRNGSWFWISKMVWQDNNLSASDKVVYGTLAYFANQNQIAWPSVRQLAEFGDVSERQTSRSIKNLESKKYLLVKRFGVKGKSNEYCLLKIKDATMSSKVRVTRKTK